MSSKGTGKPGGPKNHISNQDTNERKKTRGGQNQGGNKRGDRVTREGMEVELAGGSWGLFPKHYKFLPWPVG